MADQRNHDDSVYRLAVGLLLLGALLHYGWAFVPAEHQAQAWNALGAFARACLLVSLVWHIRSVLVLAVAGWWLAEEAMVAGCSLAYIARPWEVAPGQAQCSALLSLDLGRLGVVAVACIALIALRRTYKGL